MSSGIWHVGPEISMPPLAGVDPVEDPGRTIIVEPLEAPAGPPPSEPAEAPAEPVREPEKVPA